MTDSLINILDAYICLYRSERESENYLEEKLSHNQKLKKEKNQRYKLHHLSIMTVHDAEITLHHFQAQKVLGRMTEGLQAVTGIKA